MGEAAGIRVLGLDHAPCHTGWSIGRPCWPEPPAFGCFNLKPWGVDEPDRMVSLYRWLDDLVVGDAITHIFYEAPTQGAGGFYRGGRWIRGAADNLDTRTNQGAVIGAIWLVAGLRKIPVQKVAISSWRSRFLGTTKADIGLKGVYEEENLKQKALKACALRGWLVEDHNAAEAIGICDYGLACLSKGHAGWGDPIFRRAQAAEDTARVRARAQGQGRR